jgi:D-alanyl-D-alanine dipeptidase
MLWPSLSIGIPGADQVFLVLQRAKQAFRGYLKRARLERSVAAAGYGLLTLIGASARAGADGLPQGFVYLRDVAPSILQDMRYTGPDNFTGKPVPGYDAAECILKRGTAEALKRAQEDAEKRGFSLKVYDCYRPARAVRVFLAWAKAPEDGRTKAYYPHLRKSQLVPAYIASRSSHSRGAAVDVTLVPSASAPGAGTASGKGGCTAPASEREPDNSLDMGTGFDCLDPKANTAAPSASPEARKNRALLRSILESAGFKNYAGEWWHFSYSAAGDTRTYDFPVSPRPPG